MKIPKFEFTGKVAIAIVIIIFAVVFFVAHYLSGNQEFQTVLKVPMRDMTIGQGMAFLMFAWFLFK